MLRSRIAEYSLGLYCRFPMPSDRKLLSYSVDPCCLGTLPSSFDLLHMGDLEGDSRPQFRAPRCSQMASDFQKPHSARPRDRYFPRLSGKTVASDAMAPDPIPHINRVPPNAWPRRHWRGFSLCEFRFCARAHRRLCRQPPLRAFARAAAQSLLLEARRSSGGYRAATKSGGGRAGPLPTLSARA